jgi:hypothetical protein
MAAYHPDDIGKHQEKRLASLVSGEPVINEVREEQTGNIAGT